MIYAGIDPGKDGAVAAIERGPSGPRIVGLVDTPMLKEPGGGKRSYDEQGMRSLLAQLGRYVCVVIERQSAMPGQGVTSMFSIGEGYGLWRGLLAGLQIPYAVVMPQSWKKALMAGAPRTAQASVAAALRFYPSVRDQLMGPKGGLKDGRADAILLAHWALYHGPSRASP